MFSFFLFSIYYLVKTLPRRVKVSSTAKERQHLEWDVTKAHMGITDKLHGQKFVDPHPSDSGAQKFMYPFKTFYKYDEPNEVYPRFYR